jgi:hypothetical protein
MAAKCEGRRGACMAQGLPTARLNDLLVTSISARAGARFWVVYMDINVRKCY